MYPDVTGQWRRNSIEHGAELNGWGGGAFMRVPKARSYRWLWGHAAPEKCENILKVLRCILSSFVT